jgi:hypothetical protein
MKDANGILHDSAGGKGDDTSYMQFSAEKKPIIRWDIPHG